MLFSDVTLFLYGSTDRPKFTDNKNIFHYTRYIIRLYVFTVWICKTRTHGHRRTECQEFNVSRFHTTDENCDNIPEGQGADAVHNSLEACVITSSPRAEESRHCVLQFNSHTRVERLCACEIHVGHPLDASRHGFVQCTLPMINSFVLLIFKLL